MRKILFVFFTLVFSFSHILSEDYKIHILKKGETLWRISKDYGVSLDDICNINGINDVTNILIGAKIRIPTGINNSNNENTTKSYKVHVLEKGETLWRVSKKYDISVQELCRINNIDDITKIKSGERIKIPVECEYLEYKLPLQGEINLFKTSHFRGMHIFTEEDISKRDVYAVDNGEVSYIDNIPGYGTTVFIKHDNGLLSTYSGLEKINVEIGDKVKQDQKIGIAGNLSRYNKHGILFSIQDKGYGLEYDLKEKKFLKTSS